MSDMEENYEFACPYCAAANSIGVDPTAGRRQSFVTDCETCCQPIQMKIDVEPDGYVSVEVRQEDE